MKKLLILGGFPQMIDIVMTAKNMGVFVIVADRDSTSPAKRFADLSLDISTDKIDLLEQFCRNERVDGVFTGFEDFNIHIACALCQRLNLPFYATKEQLACVTNKVHFKEKCREYGVPVIEQYSLLEAERQGKYPYIVKPADSYGSRGITVCETAAELRAGYEKARGCSAGKSAIIERFIDADHGTELFYTIVNGTIHLTATADRYTVKSGSTTVPLPVAEIFPSVHEADMKAKLDKVVRRMLQGLKIQNGLVLIQLLYDRGDYFVYEMAYRLTGEQHYRLVKKQHGICLGEMMIRLALGESIADFDTERLNEDAFVSAAINLAIILKPGRIAKIEGLERVYQIDEVISYNLTHHEQDEIAASGNYSQMLIRVNMVARDYQKMRAAVDQINDYVKVVSDAGEDMVLTRFSLPERS